MDITIENGVIAAIEPTAGGGYDGRWVSPGLWDNHVHFSQWALVQQRLDVSASASAAEAASLVRAGLLRSDAPPVPLIGYGFRDGLWPDQPTAAVLDAVSVNSGRESVGRL